MVYQILHSGTQIFLIGDAPPHLDYADDPEPEELVAEARRSRIVINAIGCRSLYGTGVEFFRALAYATEGSYQHIGRLTSARPGELTEALGRSAMPAGDGGGAARSPRRRGAETAPR